MEPTAFDSRLTMAVLNPVVLGEAGAAVARAASTFPTVPSGTSIHGRQTSKEPGRDQSNADTGENSILRFLLLLPAVFVFGLAFTIFWYAFSSALRPLPAASRSLSAAVPLPRGSGGKKAGPTQKHPTRHRGNGL